MSDQQQNPLSGAPSSKPFGGFGAFSAASNPGTSSIANPSTSTPKPLFGSGGFGIGQNQNQPQGQPPASGGFSGWLPPNPLNSATTGGQIPGASNVPLSSQGAGAFGDPSKPITNPLSSSQTPSGFSGFPKPPGSAFFATQNIGQQHMTQQDSNNKPGSVPTGVPFGTKAPTPPGGILTGANSLGFSSAGAASGLGTNPIPAPGSFANISLGSTPAPANASNPSAQPSGDADKQGATTGSSATMKPATPFGSLGAFTLPKPGEASKDGKTAADSSQSEKANASNGKAETKPTTSSFPGFGLSGAPGTTKPTDTTETGVPVPGTLAGTAVPLKVSVSAPSTLRGKSVEDIVNRWSSELEVHTREFFKFASEVAVWDRTLIENGNYIANLYATVISAESTQASLDQTLDHVEQQQKQLTATLDQYEKSANDILHGPGGIMSSTEGLGLVDSERDKSYALAANLYTQLDDLSRSLTQMVETVNGLNVSAGPFVGSTGQEDASQDNPLSTISGILNAHLSSLQWIDSSLRDMEVKVKDAERKIKDGGARRGSHGGENSGRGRTFGLSGSRR